MKQPKLPSLAKVKKALYADWALRVKQRDGWKCLLCGATENLTAHHWYVCDHHAHAARYCVDNGATLCYACHIRGVHQRADWVSVGEVFDRVMNKIGDTVDARASAMLNIASNKSIELTTPVLRTLWGAMRARVVYPVAEVGAWTLKLRARRLFLEHKGSHPIATPCNVVETSAGLHEVLVVTKTDGGYRYTLKRLEA